MVLVFRDDSLLQLVQLLLGGKLLSHSATQTLLARLISSAALAAGG